MTLKIPGNPFKITDSTVRIDCTKCPYWNDRGGRCTLGANAPKPCGLDDVNRQERADFGGRVLG